MQCDVYNFDNGAGRKCNSLHLSVLGTCESCTISQLKVLWRPMNSIRDFTHTVYVLFQVRQRYYKWWCEKYFIQMNGIFSWKEEKQNKEWSEWRWENVKAGGRTLNVLNLSIAQSERIPNNGRDLYLIRHWHSCLSIHATIHFTNRSYCVRIFTILNHHFFLSHRPNHFSLLLKQSIITGSH